jgi:hypothetical protein
LAAELGPILPDALGLSLIEVLDGRPDEFIPLLRGATAKYGA